MTSPDLKKIIVSILIAFFFVQTIPAATASHLNTDKDVYDYGEIIKVKFYNAPGNERDWICIVPAGTPDTVGGDYKYLPVGLVQGSLTFDPPAPGKYEARAYYNYDRNGYVVSGRYAFTVKGGPNYERELQLKMDQMARTVNQVNSLEANLAPGKGLVYVLRESLAVSRAINVQIKVNDKPVVVMEDSNYFLYAVPEGKAVFSTGSYFDRSIEKSNQEVWSVRPVKAMLDIKAGYVYYLKLKVIPMGGWTSSLEQIPHQDGAALLNQYNLNLVK